MNEPKTIVDLTRMRRHYADFRAAWDHGADESAPKSPTLMTIAAVLAAEDLGVLLDYLDAKEGSTDVRA